MLPCCRQKCGLVLRDSLLESLWFYTLSSCRSWASQFRRGESLILDLVLSFFFHRNWVIQSKPTNKLVQLFQFLFFGADVDVKRSRILFFTKYNIYIYSFKFVFEGNGTNAYIIHRFLCFKIVYFLQFLSVILV